MPAKNLKSYFSNACNFKKGFTLIELLVALAIVSILFLFLLANYSGFAPRQDARNAAKEFKTLLRKYQMFAISGQKQPEFVENDCSRGSTSPIMEYYSIVADSNGYEVKLFCRDRATGGQITYDVTGVKKWQNVIVSVINSTFAPGSSCNSVEARFLPGNQGTQIFCDGNQVSPWFGSITILFADINSSVSYPVRITAGGNIYDEKL